MVTGNPIYLGVCVSIVGNIMISVALNLQKYTHNKNEKAENNVPYLKRPLWWLGLFLMLGGECGNFLSYAFAPASLVAPLGTVSLVSNAIIAPFVLKEKFRIQDFFGVVLAVAGTAIVVVFSAATNSESETYTAEQLVAALAETKFLIYVGITIVSLIVLVIVSAKTNHNYLVMDMIIVGLLAGYTVISTKAISTIMVSEGFVKMFTYWVFYVMIFVLVFTGVMQIRYLQQSLQKFDSTEVVPTQFVMYTLSAIIGGGVLYDDFSEMSVKNICLFVFGIFLTFVGVFMISKGRNHPKGHQQVAVELEEGVERVETGDQIVAEPENLTLVEKMKRSMRSISKKFKKGSDTQRLTPGHEDEANVYTFAVDPELVEEPSLQPNEEEPVHTPTSDNKDEK